MVTPASDIMCDTKPLVAVYQSTGSLCPSPLRKRLRWIIHTLPKDAPEDDYLRALAGLVVDYYRNTGRNLVKDFASEIAK